MNEERQGNAATDRLVVLETQVKLITMGEVNINKGVFTAELEIVTKWFPPPKISDKTTYKKSEQSKLHLRESKVKSLIRTNEKKTNNQVDSNNFVVSDNYSGNNKKENDDDGYGENENNGGMKKKVRKMNNRNQHAAEQLSNAQKNKKGKNTGKKNNHVENKQISPSGMAKSSKKQNPYEKLTDENIDRNEDENKNLKQTAKEDANKSKKQKSEAKNKNLRKSTKGITFDSKRSSKERKSTKEIDNNERKEGVKDRRKTVTPTGQNGEIDMGFLKSLFNNDKNTNDAKTPKLNDPKSKKMSKVKSSDSGTKKAQISNGGTLSDFETELEYTDDFYENDAEVLSMMQKEVSKFSKEAEKDSFQKTIGKKSMIPNREKLLEKNADKKSSDEKKRLGSKMEKSNIENVAFRAEDNIKKDMSKKEGEDDEEDGEELKEKKNEEEEEEELDYNWCPDFNVKNMLGNLVIVYREVTKDTANKTQFKQKLIVYGKFMFDPKYLYYPFDVQRLRMVFYCINADGRKILIMSNPRSLHYVKSQYHTENITVYDLVDSATTPDQDFYQKNYSVLILTYYVSIKIVWKNFKTLLLPYFLIGVSLIVYFVENMSTVNRVFLMVLCIILVSIIRISCNIPIFQMTLPDIYLITYNWMILLGILGIYLSNYGLRTSKFHFLFALFLLCVLSCTLFYVYGIQEEHHRMNQSSQQYKKSLKKTEEQNVEAAEVN